MKQRGNVEVVSSEIFIQDVLQPSLLAGWETSKVCDEPIRVLRFSVKLTYIEPPSECWGVCEAPSHGASISEVNPQRTSTTMELLPLVCLCLLSCSGDGEKTDHHHWQFVISLLFIIFHFVVIRVVYNAIKNTPESGVGGALKASLINSSYYAQMGAWKLFLCFLFYISMVTCCGFFLVRNVLIVCRFGQKHLLNALNVHAKWVRWAPLGRSHLVLPFSRVRWILQLVLAARVKINPLL